jgi:hypothetical protein
VSLPSGARVQTTPPEAVGPQRATSTSPLWTLESLRLEPDDAAANADRGENHDPRGERQHEQRDDLTEEMRLENGSELVRRISMQPWFLRHTLPEASPSLPTPR